MTQEMTNGKNIFCAPAKPLKYLWKSVVLPEPVC